MPGPPEKTSGLSPDLAVNFRKAAGYCALQERCISEMRLKLQKWGIGREEGEKMIKRLQDEGFIDEQRFAIAFARGKFRNLHWGKIKIKAELQRRNIGNILIINAINELDEIEYQDTIVKLLGKKIRELKPDTPENRFKAMRFLAGKGFEPELIRKLMHED